jgi:hypothetical protein
VNADPPPHAGSTIEVELSRSIIRSPRNGSGIFAINFAARSLIAITVSDSVIGGGLDTNGGVSRGDPTHDSTTRIASKRNLYRSEGGPYNPAFVGWLLTGGSGAPIPIPSPEGTLRNSLRVHSLGDLISGFTVGVIGRGGVRSFPLPLAGPSSDNTLDLQLHGTTFDAADGGSLADLWLWGAQPPADDVSTGDRNLVRVLARGVSGSGAGPNIYTHVLGATDRPQGSQGTGNRVELVGSRIAFEAANAGLEPPPADFFTALAPCASLRLPGAFPCQSPSSGDREPSPSPPDRDALPRAAAHHARPRRSETRTAVPGRCRR